MLQVMTQLMSDMNCFKCCKSKIVILLKLPHLNLRNSSVTHQATWPNPFISVVHVYSYCNAFSHFTNTHLTSRTSNRAINEHGYCEHQNICEDLPEITARGIASIEAEEVLASSVFSNLMNTFIIKCCPHHIPAFWLYSRISAVSCACAQNVLPPLP